MQRRIALVTDCLGRKSLSAVRSLGRAGYTVLAQGEERLTPAFWSRYTSERFVGTEEFEQRLLEWKGAALPPVVVLPMEEERFTWAYTLPKDQTVTLLPPRTSFEAACSKWQTYEAAQKLGIPSISTTQILNAEQFQTALAAPGQWCLKPEKSKGSAGIIYGGEDMQAIDAASGSKLWRSFGPYLLQERLPREGAGIGASFLFDPQGRCVAQFVHQRLHEYPVNGGPSTDRISIHGEIALQALKYGRQLLEHWKWQGVAMVEFKIDEHTGQLKLLEVNPRFWGSLELAVRSGVDFPRLYAASALGESLPEIAVESMNYTPGVRVRWTIPGEILRWWSTPRESRESARQFFSGFLWLAEEWDRRDPLAYFACWIFTAALVFKPRYWRLLRR